MLHEQKGRVSDLDFLGEKFESAYSPVFTGNGRGHLMRRLLSDMYISTMRFIAPALGLDRWAVSTSGEDYNFRRFNVESGRWERRALPPDGHPDLSKWL